MRTCLLLSQARPPPPGVVEHCSRKTKFPSAQWAKNASFISKYLFRKLVSILIIAMPVSFDNADWFQLISTSYHIFLLIFHLKKHLFPFFETEWRCPHWWPSSGSHSDTCACCVTLEWILDSDCLVRLFIPLPFCVYLPVCLSFFYLSLFLSFFHLSVFLSFFYLSVCKCLYLFYSSLT